MGSRSPHAKAKFLGERTRPGARVARRHSAESCAKMTEILWTRVGQRNHVLDVGPERYLHFLRTTSHQTVCVMR